MKYVISWVARPDAGEAEAARSLQVFSKWAPNPDVTFEQFLGRVDGQGGYAVVTTENIAAVARDMQIFGSWFEMSVVPVMEIGELTEIGADVVAFLASIE